jgi:hypothetical protein
MELFEAPVGVSYLHVIAPGKWRQELGYRIMIELAGAEICIGDVTEKLDEDKPLRIIVEASIAKP